MPICYFIVSNAARASNPFEFDDGDLPECKVALVVRRINQSIRWYLAESRRIGSSGIELAAAFPMIGPRKPNILQSS